jgi:Family of unknown function (DUF6297)
MATQFAIDVPDSTRETLGLLHDLSRGHKRATDLAFWLYIGGLVVLIYGGWLVAAVVRALRRPPPPTADSAMLLRAAPAALAALALLLLLALLWDARWRGPVMVAQPTADWLLGTPVRRGPLLRPRYRISAALAVVAGAAAGLVPTALLIAAGLGGHGVGQSVRLAGVTMLGTALLAGLGTGVAAWTESRPAGRAPRRVGPVLAVATPVLAGLAALMAEVRLPSAIGAVVLWSGPWGWAAQGPVALAGGDAPLWPVAAILLGLAAAGMIVAGDRLAADVPAAALRVRAHTIGDMSAAMLNLDARRVTTTYRGAVGSYGRGRIGIPVPRQRQLVLPWRDLTALIRAPARLGWSALLAIGAVGLGALAVRTPHAALLPLAGALTLGYLAAAGLVEGARLDGDDPRRSAQLPFRYDQLVWWHAIVPCLALAVLAGGPATVLALLTGKARLLAVVAASIAVLVGGALVNSFRGQLESEMFAGFDTPAGNSSGVTITLWYVTGPLLAIGPMIILCNLAVSSARPGRTIDAVVFSAALAAWLGSIAARRARRLRSG